MGTSLMVQWLRLHHSPSAGGMGLIPGQGTEIPQAAWHSRKKRKTKNLHDLDCGDDFLEQVTKAVQTTEEQTEILLDSTSLLENF